MQILRLKTDYRRDLQRIDRLPIEDRWKDELKERLRWRLIKEMQEAMR